jgi:hypothetical protein
MVSDITGWGNDNTFDYVIEPGTNAGGFSNNGKPVAAGSAEGGPIVAWLSNTGVEVQFLDVLGEPTVAAAEVASRVIVSEGADFKSNVQVADGVAAIAVGWEDTTPALDTVTPAVISSGQLKLQGLGPEGGLPFGTLVTVGAEQDDGFDNTAFHNHSMSIAGYDFTTSVAATPPNGNRPNFTVTASGINVAWVASEPGDPSAFGHIMLQRHQIVTDAAGEPAGLVAAGIDGQVDATATHAPGDVLGDSNDNAVQLGEGRDPVVTGLHTGETLVAWIDRAGNVKAQLYPPNGVWVQSDLTVNGLQQTDYDAVNQALKTQLGAIATNAPAIPQQMQVVQLGAGNFAIMWIAAGEHGLELQGTYFALPPDLAAEVVLPGGDGWTAIAIAPIALPADFTGEFNLSGMGEDNPDIVVTFTAGDGDGTGIFAVHVDGNATGAVDQVFQHSDAFEVNTTTLGNQSGGSVAGTVGDRAIITYLDEDTGNVLARMVDLREPGQFIQGDRIRDRDDSGSINAGDRIQGRADILIGTAADDTIIGDLPDPALGGVTGVRFDNPEGLDDQLFGGLGNDVIYGGGGNDVIDGGRDLSTPENVADPELGASPRHFTDTAVYQGNAQDYAIWINGDGSYSIVDAHFDDGGSIVDEIRASGAVNRDGLDLVSNVEQFLFLNGDGQALYKLGFNGEMPSTSTHVTVDASNFYVLPDQDQRVTGNVGADGLADSTPAGVETVLTPLGWGLTQDTADHGFLVTGAANVADGVEYEPLVAKTEDAFVAAWQTSNGDGLTVGLHLTVYDQFMDPVPTAAGTAVIDVTPNALASVPPALASAGAGPVIAWVSADGKLLAQAFDGDRQWQRRARPALCCRWHADRRDLRYHEWANLCRHLRHGRPAGWPLRRRAYRTGWQH